ncbi:LysR family transcriptional regulator [Streptomyces sp. CRN 30]|uniref:LysR family transcriptional regulator n=1 Tax=Streptomyces sp. CRN 30 TaxID=3075613 RepID=UPI002A828F85|nr:LysR family transcriptional regulator [Streptomyces sp. CRN 30]
MDLDVVRTFVTVVEAGRFQDAAAELSVTQQAVSKRIAALERYLGVRLFERTARGARPTADGETFLPHARELLRTAERAFGSVRPGRRPLRVDVIGRRLAPAAVLGDFRRADPGAELDVVTLFDVDAAVDALRAGTVDASFRAVTAPGRRLPDDIRAARAFDERLQLLTGPGHALAGARTVTPADLAGHRIWVPGIVPGTEWGAYYDELAAVFGLTIESTGPDFGTAPVLETLAGSRSLATLVGERTHLVWPAAHDLRRIEVRDPVPVYPHSLLWHRDNPHPTLAALREHLRLGRPRRPATGTWAPAWSA